MEQKRWILLAIITSLSCPISFAIRIKSKTDIASKTNSKVFSNPSAMLELESLITAWTRLEVSWELEVDNALNGIKYLSTELAISSVCSGDIKSFKIGSVDKSESKMSCNIVGTNAIISNGNSDDKRLLFPI